VSYPEVMTEDETLDRAAAGMSLARVGEGEFRIAIGQRIKSQSADKALAKEMRALLAAPKPASLVCLPRLWKGMPAEPFWRQFATPRYAALYEKPWRGRAAGSAFISRPDMVAAIDRPDYWAKVAALWTGRQVVLASRSTKVVDLSAAHGVRFVACPEVDAYAEVDRIEAEVLAGVAAGFDGPVLLALGPTATVLAERLARRGVQALDIGHLGRFMAVAGAYSVERAALISEAYVAQNRALHKRPEGYGGSGHKRVRTVAEFAAELEAESLLDYGCGQGTLKTALRAAAPALDVFEYDPAIKGKDGSAKPADLVVCTDVLEHVEPEKLDAVLAHIRRLARKGAFLAIATRLAGKVLPDGRNAHLIVEPASWWLPRLATAGLTPAMTEISEGHEIRAWCYF
jgi:hypothetical protein